MAKHSPADQEIFKTVPRRFTSMSGDWGQLCGGHFVYLYSFGNPTYCSEVRSSLSEVETNNGKYNKANPSSILRVKVLTGLAIAKERKCYSICIFSTRFQTPWKENHLCNPLPFGNLSLSDPPTPRNFRDPPWGGYGYFLESHNFKNLQQNLIQDTDLL